MPAIHIDFGAPALLVFLLACAGIAAAIWYYRTTTPRVSRRLRILLLTLRGTALTLLLVLLTQPLVHLSFTTVEPPTLAVLVDNSTSMRVIDKQGSRADALFAALRSNVFPRIAKRADVRLYTFGTTLLPSANAFFEDTLPLNEEATNFSVALQALAREHQQHHIDAAILLTDGTPTLGRNPLYDAEVLPMPLYTVGIGDTTEPRDLAIVRTMTNQLVYSDVLTPVNVVLRSSGLPDRTVGIHLRQGNTELAQATLQLSPGTREYEVSLDYTPHGEGAVRYTVQADILPGELTSANNRTFFVAHLLKSKLRLLLVAGFPGPDVAVLGQTLRENKNLEVTTLTQKPAGGFYEGPFRHERLDSADCLIFLGFPTAGTTPAVWTTITTALSNSRLPLLFLAGRSVAYDRLRSLGPLVPFSVDSYAPTELFATALPVESERLHPLIAVRGPEDADLWKRLPPLFRTLSLFKAHPESHVLALLRTETSSSSEPLLIARSAGGQKSLAFTGYGLWRWRLLVQSDPQTCNFLGAFLSAAVTWLTAPEEHRPLRVTPTKDVFVQGEPVEFNGQLYDPSAKPVNNARVSLQVQNVQPPVAVELRPLGNGQYAGTLEGLGEGEFTYTATANLNGSPLGTDGGKFSVGGIRLELQDTRPNFTLLRLLASRTGGTFLLPRDLGHFDSLLSARGSFAPRTIHRARDFELWNWYGVLAAALFLFAGEWVLRRRAGLL
jgi:hypothetical protein